MRARIAVPVVAIATLLPMLAVYALSTAGVGADEAAPPLGPGVVTVEVDMGYSRYSLEELRVYEGTLVRFVLTNQDPIHHELIVGGDDVHAAHETGDEAFHPPVPGEISVDPGEQGSTVYLFDEPGTVVFACHLPRHLEYGMKGRVIVVPT